MKHLLPILALLLASPVFAQTSVIGGGDVYGDSKPAGGACGAYPVDGGCSLASGAYRIMTAPQAYAAQEGQTWTGNHPWNWNSPVFDYAAGYTGPLDDPASASLPSGCAYNATGSGSGGPQITCSGSGTLTLQNLDLSLHTSVCVKVNSGYSLVQISNVYFKQGANDCSAQFAFFWIVRQSAGQCTSIEVTNSEIDGDPTATLYQSTEPFGIFDNGSCGTLPDHTTFTNVVANNLPSRLISSGATGDQTISELWVYGVSLSAAANGTHAEIWGATENNCTCTIHQSWTNVVFIQPAGGAANVGNGAAPYETVTTLSSNTHVAVTFQNVVSVVNDQTGGGPSFGSIVNSGNIATIDSLSVTNFVVDPTGSQSCFLHFAAAAFSNSFNLLDGSQVDLTHCNGHHS